MNYKKILWVSSLSAASQIGFSLDSYLEMNYKELSKNMNEKLFFDTICPPKKSLGKEQIHTIEKYTKKIINCENNKDYLKIISDLKNKKTIEASIINNEFLELIKIQAKIIDNKTQNSKLDRYTLLKHDFYLYWKYNSFYAYQLANAISLVRYAGIEGFISKETVLKELNEIGDLISNNFDSYELFAQNCIMSNLLVYHHPKLIGLKPNPLDLSITLHTLWSYISWGEES